MRFGVVWLECDGLLYRSLGLGEATELRQLIAQAAMRFGVVRLNPDRGAPVPFGEIPAT